MASKSSSPGPNAISSAPAKPSRSRKGVTQSQAEQGRAGSAGGIILDKERGAKISTTSKSISKPPAAPVVKGGVTETDPPMNNSRRKPRKLNKDPLTTPETATPAVAATRTEPPKEAISELDSLKSRVRGLEAKVEELYQSSTDTRATRSPRRRGKGRKASSSTQVPTIGTLCNTNAVGEDPVPNNEEADEELVRLEGELEVARQDLDSYRPRTTRRIMSQESDDLVEEIPREPPGVSTPTTIAGDRQVTLSGSYRIPIPANVSVEDVKNIKSGVSAAQNVARTFLEQRRAAAALRAENTPAPSPHASARAAKPPTQRAASSSLEVSVDSAGDKQSWGDWIGGYSMAITRAVKTIEHEAVMESQRGGTVDKETRPRQAGRTASTPAAKKGAGKRPPAKAKISSEQVQGLMS